MSDLTACRVCGKEIAKTAPICPNCGVELPGYKFICPRCGSNNISKGTKKFGLGKAAFGAALLGPIGLAGGFINRGKIELICQACNEKWLPRKEDYSE